MGILSDSILEDIDRQVTAWNLKKLCEQQQYISWVTLENIVEELKVVINVSDKNYPIGTFAICNKHSKYDGWLDANY